MGLNTVLTLRPLGDFLRFDGRLLISGLLVAYLTSYLYAALTAPLPLEWWLDNIVVLAFWLGAWWYRDRVFISVVSMIAILAFLFIHLVGAYYVYENVPAGEWFKQWFGWQRNHFDRLAHFAFGLCFIMPLAECLKSGRKRLPDWIVRSFPVSLIVALSAVYEILEAIVAELVRPEVGAAFLGAQGDIWDAQADMLAALLGSVAGLLLFSVLTRIAANRK